LDNPPPCRHNAGELFPFEIMKFLFDIFPVLLFFLAYKIWGIYVATAVAIGATLLQVSWSWFRHRKVDNMLWVSFGIIVVFGGATLLLHNETFIKWKPTVLYWLFAVTLPDPVWRNLNLSWIGFFALMGAANLYVAFSFPTDVWVNFKLFGGIGLMLVFVLAQGLMLSRYIEQPEEKK
jgi:intracellular septation protein